MFNQPSPDPGCASETSYCKLSLYSGAWRALSSIERGTAHMKPASYASLSGCRAWQYRLYCAPGHTEMFCRQLCPPHPANYEDATSSARGPRLGTACFWRGTSTEEHKECITFQDASIARFLSLSMYGGCLAAAVAPRAVCSQVIGKTQSMNQSGGSSPPFKMVELTEWGVS